jgi:putative FmdB family regulatory protein
MPLFEYECKKCLERFEALVTSNHKPKCPTCQGEDLQKLYSSFGVGSGRASGSSFPVGGG